MKSLRVKTLTKIHIVQTLYSNEKTGEFILIQFSITKRQTKKNRFQQNCFLELDYTFSNKFDMRKVYMESKINHINCK